MLLQIVLHELPNAAIIIRSADCFHGWDEFSHYLARINTRKRLIQKGEVESGGLLNCYPDRTLISVKQGEYFRKIIPSAGLVNRRQLQFNVHVSALQTVPFGDRLLASRVFLRTGIHR